MIGFYFGSPSCTRTNDTVSCGARQKTSLKRRFSVDRCAILRLFVQAVIDRIQFERKKIKTFKRTSLFLAPPVGLEPTTPRLTAACSTDWAKEECWRYLSSRAVSSQVLSAERVDPHRNKHRLNQQKLISNYLAHKSGIYINRLPRYTLWWPVADSNRCCRRERPES